MEFSVRIVKEEDFQLEVIYSSPGLPDVLVSMPHHKGVDVQLHYESYLPYSAWGIYELPEPPKTNQPVTELPEEELTEEHYKLIEELIKSLK